MKEKKAIFFGLVPALLALAAVFVTEQVFKPAYAVKSLVKVACFVAAVAVCCLGTRQSPRKVIGLHRLKNPRPLILSMLVFFLGILSAFFLLRRFLDLPSIRQSLTEKEGLTKNNCVFVFLYISLCNSFLEESFFRGFLGRLFPQKRVGALVSAVLFSLYHIGIFVTWFSLPLFFLCLAGLALVGLFLQWLKERHGSVLAGYVTHACANLAINLIGLFLIFEWI